MSERACNEAISNMYNDIHQMNILYNEMKNEITKISTDIGWMREDISGMKEQLSVCNVCKNPDELIKKIEANERTIYEVRDETLAGKNKAIGISIGVSLFAVIVGLILKFVV